MKVPVPLVIILFGVIFAIMSPAAFCSLLGSGQYKLCCLSGEANLYVALYLVRIFRSRQSVRFFTDSLNFIYCPVKTGLVS